MNRTKLRCWFAAAFFAFIIGSPAMAIESPKYEVITKDAEFEVRKYAPYIVAGTTVEASFGDATNEGFKKLAGYIFGANTSKQKIAMTAPVGQELREGKYVVTFSMPSEYTLDFMVHASQRNFNPDRK